MLYSIKQSFATVNGEELDLPIYHVESYRQGILGSYRTRQQAIHAKNILVRMKNAERHPFRRNY